MWYSTGAMRSFLKRGCRTTPWLFAVLLTVVLPGALLAAPDSRTKLVRVSDTDISIDGKLSEAVWQTIPAMDSMTVVRPDLLIEPRFRTETRLFYTERGMYVGITAEQPPETLLARLSSRDKRVNRDGVIFYLDTSGEGRYGFYFGVNLGGSLTDGTILPERQTSQLWDGAWYGQSAITEDGYTTEMFLPWSMLSMPDTTGDRHMGFFVNRRVAHLDEEWGWPSLPSTGTQFLSGFRPIAVGEVRPARQVALYPFAASSYDKMKGDNNSRAGVDIFWKPSSALQTMATINPDFGTVESDDVVVNLTAFESYFPEKRLFFLEGNEIFVTSPRSARSSTGSNTGARPTPNTFFLEPTTLLNTRRIGGPAPRPEIPEGITVSGVELGKPTELLGAAKLIGEHGDFRYGILAAAEDDTDFIGSDDATGAAVRVKQTGRDFGVLRGLYETTDNGRKGIGFMSTVTSHPDIDARTSGVDLHYRSPSSKIRGDGQLMYSDVAGSVGKGGVCIRFCCFLN